MLPTPDAIVEALRDAAGHRLAGDDGRTDAAMVAIAHQPPQTEPRPKLGVRVQADEMKQGIASRPKGADLLSRTPAANEFVIPPIELGDQLIVTAAQLQRIGAERSRLVASVEKMALYYIALTPHLANARQLTEFVARAVERMPPGEQRIKYDHLFEPGDPENKRFWLTASEANPSFVATYVTLPRDTAVLGTKTEQRGDTPAASPGRPSESDAGADVEPELALPDKPSIAVLAFDNLSGDPDQEYFADGVAEDIITALSKFRWFFVIARNSSFTYKGKAVDVKQVAGELGVRFVLEGSVRKAGSRVRINAQLIEGATGNHVWAERYDRELADIFDLQDEMTETIVGAIEPELANAVRARARQKPPDDLDAWDRHQRGLWHLWKQFTRDDSDEAELQFRRAIELDPDFGPAHAGLALVLQHKYLSRWTERPGELLEEASGLGRRAVTADDRGPLRSLCPGSCPDAGGRSRQRNRFARKSDRAQSQSRARVLRPRRGAHVRRSWTRSAAPCSAGDSPEPTRPRALDLREYCWSRPSDPGGIR